MQAWPLRVNSSVTAVAEPKQCGDLADEDIRGLVQLTRPTSGGYGNEYRNVAVSNKLLYSLLADAGVTVMRMQHQITVEIADPPPSCSTSPWVAHCCESTDSYARRTSDLTTICQSCCRPV